MLETRFLSVYDLRLDIITVYTLTVTTSGIFSVAGISKIFDLIYEDWSTSIIALGRSAGRGNLWMNGMAFYGNFRAIGMGSRVWKLPDWRLYCRG